MHDLRTTSATGLVIALAASCGLAPTGLAVGSADLATSRTVALHNRTAEPLWLCRASRDGWLPPTALANEPRLSLQLSPGRYAIQLGQHGPKVPLPLPPSELGYRPPATVELTLWPWPEPMAGWCWIPPGISLQGDDLGIGQEDERPLSCAELPGFWLAAFETNNAQFVEFLNQIAPATVDPSWLDLDGSQCHVHWSASKQAFTTDAASLPVVTVSWQGATAYCAWRTEQTGIRHRLPTEAEWEKAARGPGSRVYCYGDTFQTLAANQESGQLVAAGTFAPNGFGLFDMTGNAFEWTKDAYHRGATAQRGEDHMADYRSLRGGSFVLDGIFVRNSMRMRLRPQVRADDVGFRVLREPSEPHFGAIAAKHQIHVSHPSPRSH